MPVENFALCVSGVSALTGSAVMVLRQTLERND